MTFRVHSASPLAVTNTTVQTVDLGGFSQWVVSVTGADVRILNSPDVNETNYFVLPQLGSISSEDHPRPSDGRIHLLADSATPVTIQIGGIRRESV